MFCGVRMFVCLFVWQEMLDSTGKIPRLFSASPVNTLWHGSSHGVLAFSSASLVAFRELGLLSDLAMDACGRMNWYFFRVGVPVFS
jgi:hypothetical protein